MQYLWLALLVLSVVLECLVTKGIFFCFIPSSLVSMILAFCGVSVTIQLIVFFALVLGAFFFIRPIIRRAFSGRENASFAVENAIGMRTVVVERLDNLAGRGAVRVHGMEWAARTLSDEIVIEEGSAVEIIGVEGVKYICRKV